MVGLEMMKSRAPKRTTSGHSYYSVPSLQPLREERGMSRAKLADLASMTRVTIYHIESGKHLATVDTVYRLAEALEVTPMDLVLPLPEGEDAGET